MKPNQPKEYDQWGGSTSTNQKCFYIHPHVFYKNIIGLHIILST